jgi:hypothetical protein
MLISQQPIHRWHLVKHFTVIDARRLTNHVSPPIPDLTPISLWSGPRIGSDQEFVKSTPP